MMRCDYCQAQLLDHLYGLLEPADVAALEQHLASCPACSSAREQAGRLQGLFARAARSQFPQVRFVPPSEEEVNDPGKPRLYPESGENGNSELLAQPSSIARTGQRATARFWSRWAIAAGVLILAPALLLPITRRAKEYEAAKGKADAAATRLADARSEISQAQSREERDRKDAVTRYTAAWDRTQALVKQWVDAEKAADAAEKNRKVAVSVARPQSVVAGAPNEFLVAIHDRGNTLRGRRVEAEVRDQDGKTLYQQQIEATRKNDSQIVRLPADVWSNVKPQSELFLSVTALDEKTRTRTVLQEPIRLFGPVYTTMLVTDKSSYRPGEPVYFRSLTLDRVSFRPPDREQVLQFSLRRADGSSIPGAELYGTTGLVRVADGSVEPVIGPDGTPVRGVGCGAFALPPDLADGDYILTLSELPGRGGLPPVQAYPVRRLIEVRSGLPARLTKAIGFTAASFAPGQAVDAWAEVQSKDKPLAGATARAVVTVDGNPLPLVRLTPQQVGPDGKAVPTTGADGRVRIRFVLPKQMSRGDVRLMVTFRTQEAEETLARRVPITGRDLIVEFFPEGGGLIAGIPNRVYVRATTADGKPVDIRGELLDHDTPVSRVESPKDENEPGVNRGLGSFTFTPRADRNYRFRIAGMPNRVPFDLPKVQSDGVAMTVPSPVVAAGEPIVVRLHSTGRPRNLVVGAYIRGRMADTQRVTVKRDEIVEVRLITNNDPRGGVTRITVFEDPADPKADLIPLAERLAFRRPGEVLNLAASAGAPGTVFAPGSPVEVNIAATDEKGRPVPAIIWAAAVNSAVEHNATDRSLPTHFLLAGEIETPDDLEYADFLLTDHPKAASSLDLVLATQGWRRFVEQSSPTAVARGRQDRAELLVKSGAFPVATPSGASRDHSGLHRQYWPKYEKSVKELDAAAEHKGAVDQRASDPALAELFALYEARRRETAEVTAVVRSAAQPLIAARQWVNVGAGVLAVLAALLGVVAVVRPNGVRGLVPLVVASIAAGGLAVFLAFESSRPVMVEEAGQTGGEAPSKIQKPVPQQNQGSDVEPKGPPRIVKDSGVKKGIVEPRVLAGKSDPTRPPKFPSPPSRSALPLEAFGGPEPTGLIPDTRLQPEPRSARPVRMMAMPAVPGGLDAERRVLSRIAEYARSRAIPLASPLEVLLPDDKRGVPVVPSPEADAGERIRDSVPWDPPLAIREYAAPRPGTAVGQSLVSDTVLWKPVIVLQTSGRGTVTFYAGDAQGYQLIVAGHTLYGRIGTVRMTVGVAPNAGAVPPPAK